MIRGSNSPWVKWGLAALTLVLFAPLVVVPLVADEQVAAHEGTMFFEQHIRPLLAQHCFRCHGPREQKAGLRLDKRAFALAGSESGPVIVPGKPEASLLIRAVHYLGPKMPPEGKLPPEKIVLLEQWVRMGAPWPDDGSRLEKRSNDLSEEIAAAARSHWAFRPVRRPRVPLPSQGRLETPVDAFIIRALAEAGLHQAPRADIRTLVRRLHFDLLGLPPSPEIVDFVARDPRPDRVARLVDRLLASPHYGERWGRHWLDLVRYAQTNGYERDAEKPEAWRYRDYVVESFNEDKPYDRFIMEQLAGDELPDASPETVVATGYYRLGVWDDEPDDKLVALAEEFDDVVRTTGETFLGLTIGCARCHEHKFDPMPQEDYYSFLAFFRNIAPYGKDTSYTHWAANPDAIFVPLLSADEFRQWKQRQEQLRAELEAVREELARYEQQVREQVRQERLSELSDADRNLLESDPTSLTEEERKRRAELEKGLRIDQKQLKAELGKRIGKPYKKLEDRAKQLEAELNRRPFARALAVREKGPEPEPTYVFRRGNPRARGEQVEPRVPLVLGGHSLPVEPLDLDQTSEYRRILSELGVTPSSGRRLALARWIASPENPLSSRVMANRVWQYHMGKGIVRTPNDFGKTGIPPTHPELLDWLASRLIEFGWSVKRLHREIVLSATYQQSSAVFDRLAVRRDPDNTLWWRFEARRLEAEAIRDSILVVAGTWNSAMGGRGVFPELEPEVLATQSRPGSGWGKSSPAEQTRRSVYIYVKRTLGVPFLELFDFPKPDRPAPVRAITTIAPQALTLMNSRFVESQAEEFARRLLRNARVRGNAPAGGAGYTPFICEAYRIALQRDPDPQEMSVLGRFLEAQAERWRRALAEGEQPDEEEVLRRVLTDLARVVFNLNEFVYLE